MSYYSSYYKYFDEEMKMRRYFESAEYRRLCAFERADSYRRRMREMDISDSDSDFSDSDTEPSVDEKDTGKDVEKDAGKDTRKDVEKDAGKDAEKDVEKDVEKDAGQKSE